MAEDATEPDAAPKKSSKLPLLIGLVSALLFGGGGFYAVHSGLVLPAQATGYDVPPPATPKPEASPIPDTAFVAIEPLVLNFGRGSQTRHLRFRAHLEVDPAHAEEVQVLLPRVIDVLNTYLRALEIDDLERADALTRLRSQLLRRAKMVTGEGRVRDLLIMEFVLN